MKITLEAHGKKIHVETSNDDVCITEMISILKGLLVQADFHPCTVDDVFSSDFDDCSWNLDREPMSHIDLDRTTLDEHNLTNQTI
jgi:hypothetical protein